MYLLIYIISTHSGDKVESNRRIGAYMKPTLSFVRVNSAACDEVGSMTASYYMASDVIVSIYTLL
jgi:hypothetical protein